MAYASFIHGKPHRPKRVMTGYAVYAVRPLRSRHFLQAAKPTPHMLAALRTLHALSDPKNAAAFTAESACQAFAHIQA